jgi:ABC-2 type transport system permease protein
MEQIAMFKIQKYVSIFNLSFLHAFKNYKALIGLSIFLMTCLIIFAHLWKIAAAKTGVVTFTPEQLLWYIAFNEWVLVSIPDTQEDMEQDLRSGRLAYLLPRPISYLGATFAEALGTLTVNLLILGFVTFLFTWWQVGALPFHPAGLLITILFGFMAGLIAVIFQMLIGLSAFWLQEVSPFFWIWEKLLFMLGGLMLPLTVYPQWMQTLAHFTPFPAILGERSALALDFNMGSILTLTLSLTGWGIFGLICLLLVYRKGLRILNVEGG